MPQQTEVKQEHDDSTSTKHRSWRSRIIKTVIVLLLGSVAGGLTYGWYFAQRKLVPLIETEAGNYLDRP